MSNHLFISRMPKLTLDCVSDMDLWDQQDKVYGHRLLKSGSAFER